MIPEGAKQYIGEAGQPIVREVESGAIRRYAQAVGNNNPLYYDNDYAFESRYGSIIAPPGFFGWPMKPTSSSTGLPDIVVSIQATLAEGGFGRILDGGISYEFHLPIRSGDKLVASTKVENFTEKESKSGPMIICNLETIYINQNGDLVTKASQTFIAR